MMIDVERDNIPDIYYTEEYGLLCEEIEGGKAKQYEFVSNEGVILYEFLIREIETKIDGKIYYDIITPYGYGGPVITKLLGDKERLLRDFEESFSNFCVENRIISEFIRFHPMLNNALDFKSIYNVEYMHHTVATNLHSYDDPITEEFGKSCRKSIRKCIQQGITTEIVESPTNLEEFIDIYYETMDRNNAERFYYFGKGYFDSCLKYFANHIVLVNAILAGKVICSELFLCWGRFIHSHLSGTRNDYLSLSPDYLVMNAITCWGKEKGFDYVHTGGGTTNANDDSLYLFKKKFAKNTDFDFYVGKKIRNTEIYNELCSVYGTVDEGFFPAYRRR